jgi:HSP20 family protein
MAEWFDRLNEQLETVSRQWSGDGPGLGASGPRPAVDLIDRGEEFVVTIDLPGYTQEAVSVRLADDALFVSAERDGVEETDTQGEDTYVRMERSHESISRSIRLPAPVDPDGASARMNNGVLTITIEKATATGGESIEVE